MKNETPRTDAHYATTKTAWPTQSDIDFARALERDNANLRDALCDMVAVAESQGWDNAEIHNAREALSGVTPKNK
jgi:hypothetical protein